MHPLLQIDRATWSYTLDAGAYQMHHASGVSFDVAHVPGVHQLRVLDTVRVKPEQLDIHCPLHDALPTTPDWPEAMWAVLDRASGTAAVQEFNAAYARIQTATTLLGATAMVSIDRYAMKTSLNDPFQSGDDHFDPAFLTADPDLVQAVMSEIVRILGTVAHVSVPTCYFPEHQFGHWTHVGKVHWTPMVTTQHARLQALEHFRTHGTIA